MVDETQTTSRCERAAARRFDPCFLQGGGTAPPLAARDRSQATPRREGRRPRLQEGFTLLELLLVLQNKQKQLEAFESLLFQFSLRDWGKAFCAVNHAEHGRIIELFESGTAEELSRYVTQVHWSFNWQQGTES